MSVLLLLLFTALCWSLTRSSVICHRRIRRTIEIDCGPMLPVNPLSPPTVACLSEAHVPVSSLANVRACGDLRDYRRLNFRLTGDDIPVYGTCFRCDHAIIGTATFPLGPSKSVELLCPACNESFCEVDLGMYEAHQNVAGPELRISCTCGSDTVQELIMCQACGSWQHRSCYYTGLITPIKHQCVACNSREA